MMILLIMRAKILYEFFSGWDKSISRTRVFQKTQSGIKAARHAKILKAGTANFGKEQIQFSINDAGKARRPILYHVSVPSV